MVFVGCILRGVPESPILGLSQKWGFWDTLASFMGELRHSSRSSGFQVEVIIDSWMHKVCLWIVKRFLPGEKALDSPSPFPFIRRPYLDPSTRRSHNHRIARANLHGFGKFARNNQSPAAIKENRIKRCNQQRFLPPDTGDSHPYLLIKGTPVCSECDEICGIIRSHNRFLRHAVILCPIFPSDRCYR